MPGYIFIVNPQARNKKVGKLWEQSETRIKELDLDHQVAFSEYQGHAIELATELGSPNDVRVAVGGDGTANEVANGAFSVGAPFTIIPLGNGNDYAHNFEFGESPYESIDMLIERQPVKASVAKVVTEECTRYGFNVIDVGVSADVAAAAHTEAKWLKGNTKYTYLGSKSKTK